MHWIETKLWLIPLLPLAAAGAIAFCRRRHKTLAISLSLGSMGLSFLLACAALTQSVSSHGVPAVHTFTWLEFGSFALKMGWILDPLSSVMAVMVTFIGTLIFMFSVGYMAHDANVTRFFGFLSLFAAAMLGVVLSDNLLLLFGCWELVGLASYLLIGFWFHKPSAAAAAKKAFLTTRIGDLGLFLGMLWLYSETGTLQFYDHGNGCLESTALAQLVGKAVGAGCVASAGISLLIFCGAIGKSGQVPLHVWLPDAMEGPTPVSALIHAATMVAAGVFLMARVYPLLAVMPAGSPPGAVSIGLQAVAWIGSVTALFAALIACAQTDIKRILAYSTVSQLGYMFVGLATGGVAVGMFHLLTHAFFKALLFLGAGSVIHGMSDEQDIRKMGGLRRWMPITFATYGIGMMALSGVPLLFSGFWSKDEILHAAVLWTPSKWPFAFVCCGAALTAFYMTRQMIYVFFGTGPRSAGGHADYASHEHAAHSTPHESPAVMTVPLAVLAACTVLLSVLGTPAWPWLHGFLSGHAATFEPSIPVGTILVMLLSVCLAGTGIGLGWWMYGRRESASLEQEDPLETWKPAWFAILRNRFWIDELYAMSVVRWLQTLGTFSHWLDQHVLAGVLESVRLTALGFAWLSRLTDDFGVNLGFQEACERVRAGGIWLSNRHSKKTHRTLQALGWAIAGLLLWIVWS